MNGWTRVWLVGLLLAGLSAGFWIRKLEREIDPAYTLVEEGLYVGRAVKNPPPGVTAVVNLCGLQDPYAVTTNLWLPVLEGGTKPEVEFLSQAVAFIAAQRREGRVVFVHCRAGMNRSATVVAAYLMREHGLTDAAAVARVRERRPQIQPNPTMLHLLAEWQAGRAPLE